MTKALPQKKGDDEASLRAHLTEWVSLGDIELPMLPQVANELLMLAGNDQTDLRKLTDLIHRDQALAAQVLKIANSPAYASATRIVSLQQAVSRLGMRMLSEIATAVSVGRGIFRVKGHDNVVRSMWQTSLAAGLFAREIARLRRRNVESGFLCGLLHGIGSPIVLKEIATFPAKLVKSLDVISVVQEFDVQIGVRIAKQWKLPAQVCEAIEYYRNYNAATTHRDEAMMTYFAVHLAKWLLFLQPKDQPLPEDQVISDLNLYPDDVAQLLGKEEMVRVQVNAMGL